MIDRDDDALPDEVLQRLLEALVPGEQPSASLKARVMERVGGQSAPTAITTVRAGEGEWTVYIPGVLAKVLHDDGTRRSWYARLEAGARVPPHHHDGDEEILMMEGSCEVDGLLMQPGDYTFSPAGTDHGAMTTTTGCLLLLRSPSPAAANA